ncbi:mevalonate kinase family protein [Legionella sp. WA2022007384]
MKWLIPAKTFLLGEYAAVAQASALLLTTAPCFELTLTTQEKTSGIHPESPAGIWWHQQNLGQSLLWNDPYAGRGGLGASSAQFLASYLASCFVNNTTPDLKQMLNAYYESSWTGKGLRPSGYDVIAQSQQGCVYINKQHNVMKSYDWPFHDLSFFLIHTGVKLATHHHLQDTALPDQINYLSLLVDEAKQAFEQVDSQKLIRTINNYHQKLAELNLVAEHSLKHINEFKKDPEILAIKGCGALGADVLLLITSSSTAQTLADKLKIQDWTVLATEKDIYAQAPLMKQSYFV